MAQIAQTARAGEAIGAQRKPRSLNQLYATLNGYADRMALRFAGATALLCGAAAWVSNWGRSTIPFASDAAGFGVQLFFLSILTAFAVSAIALVMGLRYRNSLVPPALRRSWVWSFLPLALANAVAVGLVAAVVLQFVSLVFRDLSLPAIYAVALVGIGCGAVAYIVANRNMQVRVGHVLQLFGVTLLGGIAISAITGNNPMWWEQSFSFLGERGSDTRSVFNATLIISGMLMVILQQFFMDDFVYLRSLGLLTPRKTQLVRGSLIAMGVLMALVGIIPFGVNGLLDNLHSFSAYGLALILLAHMVLVRRLLPYFSREFFITSWVAVVLLVAVVTLHLLGSINTVGVELLAFAIGGSWLTLFIKNVELLVEHVSSGSVPITAANANNLASD